MAGKMTIYKLVVLGDGGVGKVFIPSPVLRSSAFFMEFPNLFSSLPSPFPLSIVFTFFVFLKPG